MPSPDRFWPCQIVDEVRTVTSLDSFTIMFIVWSETLRNSFLISSIVTNLVSDTRVVISCMVVKYVSWLLCKRVSFYAFSVSVRCYISFLRMILKPTYALVYFIQISIYVLFFGSFFFVTWKSSVFHFHFVSQSSIRERECAVNKWSVGRASFSSFLFKLVMPRVILHGVWSHTFIIAGKGCILWSACAWLDFTRRWEWWGMGRGEGDRNVHFVSGLS